MLRKALAKGIFVLTSEFDISFCFYQNYECEVLPYNGIRNTYFIYEQDRKGIFVLMLIFWVAEKEFVVSDYMTVYW